MDKYLLNKIDKYIGEGETIYVLIVESNNLDDSFQDYVNTLEFNKWNLCVSKNKKKLQEMADDLNDRFNMPNETQYFYLSGLVEFAEYVTSKYNLHLPRNYIDFPTFKSSYEPFCENKTKLMEYKKRIEKLKPFMTLDPYPSMCRFAGISYTDEEPETEFYVQELYVV